MEGLGIWLGVAVVLLGPALFYRFKRQARANEELEANPTLINADCYGKGWMYRIKPADISQINSLIHGGKDVLEAWLQEDIKKFKKD